MRALYSAIIVAWLISGCGGGLFEKKKPIPPLPAIEEEIRISVGWSASISGSEQDSVGRRLALTDDGLFIASADGSVMALDPATGKRLWRRRVNTEITGGPGVGNGSVVVGDHKGKVYSLAIDSGELLWEAQTSSEILAAPAVGRDFVAVRVADGNLFNLAAASGESLWVHADSVPPLSLRGTSPPVIYDDTIISGFDSGILAAFEAENGTILWEEAIGSSSGSSEIERMNDIDARPVISGDNVYVASYQEQVVALNILTGRAIWSKVISTYSDLAVDEKSVYVAGDDGYLTRLDSRTGEIQWQQELLKDRLLSAPAVVQDYVICADQQGWLHWFHRDDGRPVGRYRLGSALTAPPVIFTDSVITHTQKGRLSYLRHQLK